MKKQDLQNNIADKCLEIIHIPNLISKFNDLKRNNEKKIKKINDNKKFNKFNSICLKRNKELLSCKSERINSKLRKIKIPNILNISKIKSNSFFKKLSQENNSFHKIDFTKDFINFKHSFQKLKVNSLFNKSSDDLLKENKILNLDLNLEYYKPKIPQKLRFANINSKIIIFDKKNFSFRDSENNKDNSFIINNNYKLSSLKSISIINREIIKNNSKISIDCIKPRNNKEINLKQLFPKFFQKLNIRKIQFKK